MLHIVNKSPFERNALESCIRLAKSGSAILLIEDAVYGAMAETTLKDVILAAQKTMSFYVLEPDMKARGISDKPLLDGLTTVDYGGFVDLTIEHDSVQSWL